MRFVAEQQLTALQSENEALRNACDSTSARLVYAHDQIKRLEQQLRAAAARASNAEADLEKARLNTGPRVLTDQEKMYGRLGLTPSIPSAFLPHIRRAVLMTLHPDRHVPEKKTAAERRFIEAMAIVEKIYIERKL
jgi:hypothetical protein